MGSTVRQKRKLRSSRPVVRQHNSRKRPANPTGNLIVAQNWDKTQTLSQNYRRLGLMNRLNHPTGGVEKLGTDVVKTRQKNTVAGKVDPLRINGKAGLLQGSSAAAAVAAAAAGGVREVRVERDADGKIVRVVEEADGSNPLHPLHDLLDVVEDEWNGFDEEASAASAANPNPIVSALEAIARQPVGPKHVRHQSEGERTWLQKLVDQYGTTEPDEKTLAAMARDRRRNPMQRTAADLGRRLEAFRANGGCLHRVAA